MEMLLQICIALFQNNPLDGAGGPTLTISGLDLSGIMEMGMGVNNPTIHITGGINVPLPCAADITGDETVNVADLLAVITNWGACNDCQDCPADIAPACAGETRLQRQRHRSARGHHQLGRVPVTFATA